MDCRACGATLTPGARFCAACGAPVSAACRACGGDLPPAAHFCPACGSAVTDAAPPASVEDEAAAEEALRDPGRERKLATLLFADIVDFTGLNEAQDPELVSGLVADTFERLAREVERYEGTIEKFAGDAMLAVFGVPATHEDDPERAVRAALEMQSVAQTVASAARGGPALRLRIGVESGEVLVDRTRAAEERDLFVTGDAVNTASRLQSAAEPGTVVVGPGTYAATRDAVDYFELPSLELKGKAVPVAAWRAVAVKTGRDGRTRLGLESPLVGRDGELALLKQNVRRTVDDGRPQLVTVIGSAGVGKSRLVWELEKYLDGLPERYHWRKGRCLAYAGPSFGPIADVAKVDARILDDDPPTEARSKLSARLRTLELGDDEVDVRDAIEAVLGIGDGREHPREELFEAWRRYFGAVAAVAPLVLIVEDIHWADDGLLDFLDFLARWGEGPMVILCLTRPELLERHGGWGGGLRSASTIMLEPLGQDASSALMAGLLDGGVPELIGERIIELAEGNPLFAEEMVRMLVDRGTLRFADGHWELARPVDEVEIPDSVQAVLAARLDALPENEKRLAQDAAVVGRIFWDIVVAHLARTERTTTDELLRRLRVKDLVVPRSPSSLAEAGEYGFRHVLIRDVAYDSLPKRDRSRLHRDIAAWAEEELADRVDEFSELIAGHLAAAVAYEEEFATAGDGLRAVRELARAAALRAATRAGEVGQFDAVARWRRLALDLAIKLDAPTREVARLVADWGDVAWENTEAEDREGFLSDAVEAMRSLDDLDEADRQLLARLRDYLAHARYELGDVDDARAICRQGIAELEPGPATPGRARLLSRLGWTYWRAGPVEEAVPLLERAVAEAEEAEDARTLRWAKHDLGLALIFVGHVDESVRLIEESMRLAIEAHDAGLQLRCYINLPAVRSNRGDDVEPLLAMIKEGLQLARRSAARTTTAWLADNYAGMALSNGRADEALEHANEAVDLGRLVGDPHMGLRLRTRAGILALRGDLEAARRDVEAASAYPDETEPQVAESSPMTDGYVTWLDDPAGALELLRDWAGSNPELLGTPSHLARIMARMALRLHDRAALERAVELYRESSQGRTGRVFEAKRRWVDALGAGDPSGAAAAAGVLEDAGYRAEALDALADAALLAARAGVDSRALERAQALSDAMGIGHTLGRLPETRWLERPQADKSTARRV